MEIRTAAPGDLDGALAVEQAAFPPAARRKSGVTICTDTCRANLFNSDGAPADRSVGKELQAAILMRWCHRKGCGGIGCNTSDRAGGARRRRQILRRT